ncbi:polyphosphate kinase 1 [Methylicorpusculum sp.]|uniref:polyphosphate kinase 1 n=1 Tax=Methylicorpusculum sp. TaxID=2713644 RepID=UPI00272EF8C9|nr:polyphosphate kinase 1 [Methylicorpusculum sp.]MDP2177953.1 polyphosphate kinase 1 [Methylicorpusculum sp.]MDP3529644.1 polyphosphate kinase 1 [Methylicorpusculum sp.]MDZ4150237.1 polyphosphate kinase 1 [Methylicorpusculum sp.]
MKLVTDNTNDESLNSVKAPLFDLNAPEWYLNREVTWLEFNKRVLHEAEDPRTPLLERVKFIAIVSSNLDEFFMKRIGGLKQQVGAGLSELSVDGRSPQQQITECFEVVRELETKKQTLYNLILKDLLQEGIIIEDYKNLSEEDQQAMRNFYITNIFPLVTPQAIDPAHPFPFISNLSLNLLAGVYASEPEDMTLVRIKVPVGIKIPRFIQVNSDRHLFVALGDLIANNLDLLFPGMKIAFCELFRVTRNAVTEKDEEQADDLLQMIESELRERKFAPVVRLEIAATMGTLQSGMLAAELGLNEKQDVFVVEGRMGLSDLFQIAGIPRPDLQDPPHHPCDHAKLINATNIFHAIREQGTILLHHPYESFVTTVERFVKEASRDPNVQAIKMTLYRTSAGTKIVQYLMDAALNGKQVTVVIELKARFDEQANIRWAHRMEQVGIHVTYGVVGLKTHSKVIYVVRQDYNGLRRYAHIGTGNYHAGTARLYTDLGILTCDKNIGEELTELFNFLTTGLVVKRNYQHLLPAPKVLKSSLLAKIEREIKKHSDKKPGLIQFKMNALEDVDITAALYRASQAGVKIDLIVRDTCRLRPGIPGMSETVQVLSIVGRFLEHSRIFYFQNGGDEEYFIGSADCMKRNLESRVEVVAPINKPELQAQLRQILNVQLSNQRSVWEMQADGTYVQRQPTDNESEPGVQVRLIELTNKRLKEAQPGKKQKKLKPFNPHA